MAVSAGVDMCPLSPPSDNLINGETQVEMKVMIQEDGQCSVWVLWESRLIYLVKYITTLHLTSNIQ